MEATSYEGKPVLKRTQIATYDKGIRLSFVNVFDPISMAPLTFDYARSDTNETRHLEVKGKTLVFRRFPGTGDEPAQDYVAKVDRQILDFHDGMYGILLDAFSLARGLRGDVSRVRHGPCLRRLDTTQGYGQGNGTGRRR
jgi:hypothetical protein